MIGIRNIQQYFFTFEAFDVKISEEFVNDPILATDKSRWIVDFYKSYIISNADLDFEEYYKKVYSHD